MGRQGSSLGMGPFGAWDEIRSAGDLSKGPGLWFRVWGPLSGDQAAGHPRSAPGCHAHLGRLPGLGGDLGGVGRAPLQLGEGGDAGEEEGKWGLSPPPPPPPPAPEATLGFIIGSLSGSFPLI